MWMRRAIYAGAPAAPFNPAVYSNFTFDFDAARGVTKDGSNNVTALANQVSGGSALDLSGAGPVWSATVTGAGNSLPGISFPTASSKLTTNTIVFASSPTTMFFVVRSDALAAPSVICDSNGAGGRQFIQVFSAAPFTVRFNAGSSLDNSGAWSSKNMVVTVLGNGASSQVRVNGASVAGTAGSNLLGSFCLGNVFSNGQPWLGSIQRALGYGTGRSAGEITAIETALMSAYGVT